MIAALVLALALQQRGPVVVQSVVDHDHIAVGDEVVLTISATADGAGNLTLVAPTFDGFTLVHRSDRREVAATGGRSEVWEFRLRAERVGAFDLGPMQVVQGGLVSQAPVVRVEVTTPGAGLSPQLSPRLHALLEAAPLPPDSGAQVTVIVSDTSVVVGQQVDVVTTAWFPRELRLRLRRQPTLEPPSFSGVWNYPQPVPPGIAGTRQVNGAWYDQFVYHQVIFPITQGALTGASSTLHYSVPLAFQFFSQEERYDLTRDVPAITVHPLPDAGRPDGFDGAIGSGILVTREVDGTPRAGEPVSVRFVLSGRGNVALWPPPFVRWSSHLQVYPEGTDEKLDATGGILGGTKTFRYLVVPDSTGALGIPAVTYHYYDPESRQYETAETDGIRIPVARAATAVASRAEAPPLILDSEPSVPWRVVHALPVWGWSLLWIVPPLLLGAGRVSFRRRRHAAAAPELPPMLEVQHRLEGLVALLTGDAAGDRVVMARALREAGADAALAERVVGIRERLAAERFAPTRGAVGNALLQEARGAARALEQLHRRGRHRVLRGAALLTLILLAVPGRAQQLPAERLFETGAVRAAAEAFRARAAAAPAVVANWYGLGAAAYRVGDDGQAVAAWIRAAELAPRSRILARAMLLLPAPDPASAEWRTVLPVTPEEWFLGAFLCWVAAWGGVALTRGWRGRWMVVLAGAIVALGLAGWSWTREREPLAIVAVTAPLRVSPNGRAPGSRDLPIGTAIRPLGRRAGWTLARSATGEIGWIADAQVAWVRE